MAKQLTFSPSGFEVLRSGRISDSKTVGLLIEASEASGKKTFRYARRTKSGRIHKETLGTHPAHTLVEMRERAMALNLLIDRGTDPVEQRKALEHASMTVAQAHIIYMDAVERGMHRGAQKTVSPRTIMDKKAIWRGDIEPHLGSHALAAVDADSLWDVVDDKGETSPVRANRLAAEGGFNGWSQHFIL